MARAWFLGAFVAAQGPAADGDASSRTWLVHKTGVTLGCAAGHVGWSRRVQAHPLVAAALAEGGRVSDSMGKMICEYTDRLPAGDRDAADVILLGVAKAGARQDDIARLAAQMYERSRSGTPDEDPGDLDDRAAAGAIWTAPATRTAAAPPAMTRAAPAAPAVGAAAPAGPAMTRPRPTAAAAAPMTTLAVQTVPRRLRRLR